MTPRTNPEPWQQEIIDRFIHDPRLFWCDMPRDHGIEAFRNDMRTGRTRHKEATT